MNIAIKLPEKIKNDIISITKKDDVVDGIKDLVRKELIRKKAKYLFMVKNFERKHGVKFRSELKGSDTKIDILRGENTPLNPL